MYKTLVSDFSKTILFYAEGTKASGMNALYQNVKNENAFDFWKYYRLNTRLLDYYESIKEKIALYIFTAGYLHKNPAVAGILSDIFLEIYNLDDLSVDSKASSQVYKTLAKELNYLPREIVFIDDKQENIKAAELAGIKSLHFEDTDKFYTSLRELLS